MKKTLLGSLLVFGFLSSASAFASGCNPLNPKMLKPISQQYQPGTLIVATADSAGFPDQYSFHYIYGEESEKQVAFRCKLNYDALNLTRVNLIEFANMGVVNKAQIKVPYFKNLKGLNAMVVYGFKVGKHPLPVLPEETKVSKVIFDMDQKVQEKTTSYKTSMQILERLNYDKETALDMFILSVMSEYNIKQVAFRYENTFY